MVDGKRVAVVVPAHDEELLIAETLRGIPDFVDRVYSVTDRNNRVSEALGESYNFY